MGKIDDEPALGSILAAALEENETENLVTRIAELEAALKAIESLSREAKSDREGFSNAVMIARKALKDGAPELDRFIENALKTGFFDGFSGAVDTVAQCRSLIEIGIPAQSIRKSLEGTTVDVDSDTLSQETRSMPLLPEEGRELLLDVLKISLKQFTKNTEAPMSCVADVRDRLKAAGRRKEIEDDLGYDPTL